MTYTLVGAAALGFDLARLPGGARTATVLRTALACGAEDVALLAGQHPGDDVRGEWARAVAELPGPARVAEALPTAGEALARAGRGETELLRRLEAALLGDARALERLVRHDLLDWSWIVSGPLRVQDPVASRAADVLVDAATAGYRQAIMGDPLRRAMAVPLLRSGLALRGGSAPVGLSPLDEALVDLATTPAGTRERWRVVCEQLRPGIDRWAPAMHRATWALSVTERLRLAMDAQLAAVVAFHDAGFTAQDAAYGVWNAVSGAVQAIVALDLLEDPVAETLLGPWSAVYGPPRG